MKRFAYSYSLLKYVHDPLAGETVNVGVVLYSREGCFSGAKIRNTFGRFSAVFPDLNGDAFKQSLRSIERSLAKITNARTGDLFASFTNARGLGLAVLPADDSSFVWSDDRFGIATDLEVQLEGLFARFVVQYEGARRHQRADLDVWRPVREKLAERNLENRLQSKVIASDVDQVEFEHAWKNGAWHCYQPVSFDLASEDSIRDKARRWVGQITTVSNAPEQFKPYFLVGRPADQALGRACDAAVAMLKHSPVPTEVYYEDSIDILVDQIEDEIRHHDAGLN